MSIAAPPPLLVDECSAPDIQCFTDFPAAMFENTRQSIDTLFPAATSLTDAEAELIEEVGFNPKHAGEIISKGAQSIVRRFQDTNVIKLPLSAISNDWHSKIMSMIMGQDCNGSRYHYLICKKDFGDVLNVEPSDFVPGKTLDRFVAIQKYKNLERIEPFELRHGGEHREQMKLLLQRNGETYHKRGYALDIAGWDGKRVLQGAPYTNNVWRDGDNGELCLIDTGLLDYQSHVLQIIFQSWNMRKYGLDFFGRKGKELISTP